MLIDKKNAENKLEIYLASIETRKRWMMMYHDYLR